MNLQEWLCSAKPPGSLISFHPPHFSPLRQHFTLSRVKNAFRMIVMAEIVRTVAITTVAVQIAESVAKLRSYLNLDQEAPEEILLQISFGAETTPKKLVATKVRNMRPV
jgi:hypothetical protein